MEVLVFHVEQSQDHLAESAARVDSATARLESISCGDTAIARNGLVDKARRYGWNHTLSAKSRLGAAPGFT
ncbi:hypothetical protein HNR11_000926 [Nesterenkonia sandarakina]|uniref:Uncharacterized protein n=1 Tax=Nesterenkonia sandarakina TaxID=272918 RepID=A0A7Z0E799_9MICC|nr:hypothetical protein [Nesterenkonia sandarakina]